MLAKDGSKSNHFQHQNLDVVSGWIQIITWELTLYILKILLNCKLSKLVKLSKYDKFGCCAPRLPHSSWANRSHSTTIHLYHFQSAKYRVENMTMESFNDKTPRPIRMLPIRLRWWAWQCLVNGDGWGSAGMPNTPNILAGIYKKLEVSASTTLTIYGLHVSKHTKWEHKLWSGGNKEDYMNWIVGQKL